RARAACRSSGRRVSSAFAGIIRIEPGSPGPALHGRPSPMTSTRIEGLEIVAPEGAPNDGRVASILTPEACRFLAQLFSKFGPRRNELLALRAARHEELRAGKLPHFLPETAAIRGRPRTWSTAGSRSPGRSTPRW